MSKITLGKYKHFKGGEYEVIGVAKHSENLEEFVVYRPLYRQKDLWIRPFKMFLDEVEVDGSPERKDGCKHPVSNGTKKIKRFEKL